MPPSPLAKVRKLALALPEAHEVEAWEAPTFRVKNKLFAMYSGLSNHAGGHRPSLWIKALAENQQLMIRSDPERFFLPPYVGKGGWIGVWVDKGVDWDEVADLLGDAWRMTAPKTLLKRIEGEG